MSANSAPSPSRTAPSAALEALDAIAPKLVQRTLDWAAVNSGSLELDGLARMRALIVDALAELPGEPEIIPLEPSRRVANDGAETEVQHGAAVRLRVRPEAPIQVALTGHYDTVFPAGHPFQTAWVEADGRLRGPGVADMKGGIAVMLAALSAFEQTAEAPKVGYAILLSPDEEIGSPASAPLLIELGRAAHFGMTYEPALPDGALAGERAGSANFQVVARGRSVHVGRDFANGRSALLAVAEIALRLEALCGPDLTVNCGAIDGGGPVNVVPDRAVLRLNMRAWAAEALARGEASLRAMVAEIAERRDVALAVHGGVTRPPKPMSRAQTVLFSWLRQAGDSLGVPIAHRPSGGVCEGNNLFAAGCPNIDTLGVRGGAIHSADEFAIPESFAERAKLSLTLLHGVASGVFDVRDLASEAT